MADSRRTEIQVGVTVLLAVLILIVGVAWLRDFSMTRSKTTWRVGFTEVGGLQIGDEVWVNGIRKGEVSGIVLEGDRVIVDMWVDKDVEITPASAVSVRNIGLMGEKMIAVDYRAGGLAYESDQVIDGFYEPGLGEVMGQLSSTIDGLGKLSTHLGAMAEAMTENGQLSRTIQNFDQTTEQLRIAVVENRSTLSETLENLAAVSKTAKALTTDREDELQQSLDHFSSAAGKMDDLTTQLDSLRIVIRSLTDKVDRGEGTLGKLVNDEQLYADLNESVQSFKALIEDIKAHPKRYLKLSVF